MKIVLFAVGSLFAISCCAQISPGIEVGYGSTVFHQVNHPINDYGLKPHSVSSFHAGIAADCPIGKRWLLLSDLLYFGGGSRLDGNGFSANPINAQTTIKLNYLRLALNGAFRFVKGRRFSAFAGPGLFVSRGLAGKANGFVANENPGFPFYYAFDQRVDFTSHPSSNAYPHTIQVNPWDAGYTMIVGADWGDWRLKGVYSHGLERVYSQDGFDFRSQGFSVTAEWTWRLKRK